MVNDVDKSSHTAGKDQDVADLNEVTQHTAIRHMVDDVAAFHEKFHQGYDGPCRSLNEVVDEVEYDKLLTFRIDFLNEEQSEFVKAMCEGDRAGMLDALVDLSFVAIGTAYLMGLRSLGDVVFWRPAVGNERRGIVLVRTLLKMNESIMNMMEIGIHPEIICQLLLSVVATCMAIAEGDGMNFIEGWRRVTAANMAKVCVESADDSRSIRKSRYDIVKPEGWTAPVMRDLV